jgi:hypothetical protein
VALLAGGDDDVWAASLAARIYRVAQRAEVAEWAPPDNPLLTKDITCAVTSMQHSDSYDGDDTNAISGIVMFRLLIRACLYVQTPQCV